MQLDPLPFWRRECN